MKSPKTPVEKSRTTVYGIAAGLVFVAYPLSLGPATWLDKSGILPRPAMDALLTIYYPIDLMYLQSSLVAQAVDWYLDFWV
jgi:hypothetical protein